MDHSSDDDDQPSDGDGETRLSRKLRLGGRRAAARLGAGVSGDPGDSLSSASDGGSDHDGPGGGRPNGGRRRKAQRGPRADLEDKDDMEDIHQTLQENMGAEYYDPDQDLEERRWVRQQYRELIQKMEGWSSVGEGRGEGGVSSLQ